MRNLLCSTMLFLSYIANAQDSETEKIKQDQINFTEANNGNAEAMWRLALKYYNPENQEKYEEWLLKAAEKEYFKAIKDLGLLYYYSGPKENPKKSLFWLKKASSYGDPESLCKLADLYYFGRGVEKNLDLAIIYYTQAAEKNDLGASCSLYNIYSGYFRSDRAKKNKSLAEYWKGKCPN